MRVSYSVMAMNAFIAQYAVADGALPLEQQMPSRLRPMAFCAFGEEFQFIAAAGDDVVGLANCMINPSSKRLELAYVTVDPAWRHHGISTALLERVVAHAKQARAKGVETSIFTEDGREYVRHVLRRLTRVAEVPLWESGKRYKVP